MWKLARLPQISKRWIKYDHPQQSLQDSKSDYITQLSFHVYSMQVKHGESQ